MGVTRDFLAAMRDADEAAEAHLIAERAARYPYRWAWSGLAAPDMGTAGPSQRTGLPCGVPRPDELGADRVR